MLGYLDTHLAFGSTSFLPPPCKSVTSMFGQAEVWEDAPGSHEYWGYEGRLQGWMCEDMAVNIGQLEWLLEYGIWKMLWQPEFTFFSTEGTLGCRRPQPRPMRSTIRWNCDACEAADETWLSLCHPHAGHFFRPRNAAMKCSEIGVVGERVGKGRRVEATRSKGQSANQSLTFLKNVFAQQRCFPCSLGIVLPWCWFSLLYDSSGLWHQSIFAHL